MRKWIKQLAEISSKVGQRVPIWNQGYGGNISLKEDGLLLIKATGKRLQDLLKDEDFAVVQWKEVRDSKISSEEEYKNLIFEKSIKNELWGRPSMETGLHSSTDHIWILHFHSVPMILAAELFHSGQQEEISKLFLQHDLLVTAIPKLLPGLALATEFAKLDSSFSVILIRNHGVVLRSDTLEILDKFKTVEDYFIQKYQWNLEVDVPAVSPLKAFFPDTAVYWEKFLLEIVPVENGLYKLRDEAPDYLKEIWQAQSLLYKNMPQLTGFTDQEISLISSLPTEQLRKMRD